MKKIFSAILFLIFIQMQAMAFDLEPIDDEEITLPPTDSIPELDFENGTFESPVLKTYSFKKGTTLELVSKTSISDRMRKGSVVVFSLNKQVITREGEIIPKGTTVKGTVVDSHPPQIGANGGLVSLTINQINYKGQGSRIESKIKTADKKIIFRNNLKGKHTYLKNYPNSIKFGQNVYRSSKRKAASMSRIPVIKILSVVPYVFGTVIYAANIMLSPVITVFSKGGSLSIPPGTVFKIKITEDSVF